MQRDVKIKHIWTVLCQRSTIDKYSNNISLSDVLEQLTVSASLLHEQQPTGGTPVGALVFHFELVSLWSRANEAQPALGHARVVILSPSGGITEPQPIQVDLREYERMRTRQRFGGLPVREAGQFIFRVEYRDDGESTWREVAAVPLKVIIEPSPERKT